MALSKREKKNRRLPPSAQKRNLYENITSITFRTDKALKEEFMRKYKGRGSRMINDFMKAAIEMPKRIVFEMSNGEENPFDQWEGMYVFQMDVETGTKIIGAYKSLRKAGEATGIYWRNIGACCNGSRKTAGGYRWRWRVPGPQREPKRSPFD
jgi:hypothetical protein